MWPLRTSSCSSRVALFIFSDRSSCISSLMQTVADVVVHGKPLRGVSRCDAMHCAVKWCLDVKISLRRGVEAQVLLEGVRPCEGLCVISLGGTHGNRGVVSGRAALGHLKRPPQCHPAAPPMPSCSPNSNFLSLDQAIGDETLIDVLTAIWNLGLGSHHPEARRPAARRLPEALSWPGRRPLSRPCPAPAAGKCLDADHTAFFLCELVHRPVRLPRRPPPTMASSPCGPTGTAAGRPSSPSS